MNNHTNKQWFVMHDKWVYKLKHPGIAKIRLFPIHNHA